MIPADELGRVFRTWTLGDAAGALVVTPFLLTWAATGTRGIRRRDLVEGAVALAALIALAQLLPQRDVPYVVFPVLLWAAFRFGPRGAATGDPRRLLAGRLEHGPERRPVRPRVAHRQPALHAAVHRDRRADLAAARRRHRRALPRRAARGAQRALAEQAALRRVATLVASEGRPSRVFELVTEEVGRLLRVPGTNVMRYDGENTVTVVGAWSEDGRPGFPVGVSLALDGEDTVVPKVLRTGRPQRVDRYEEASGSLAEKIRRVGYRAAVAAPVTVGGRLWGVLAAATGSEEGLPRGLEQRLCDFADLVAQALANADAYEKLAASRARVVEVGDAERMRLERNLHDGAQQRFVAVALGLNVVASKLESDPAAARAVLAAARDDLTTGLAELRELARGIHPAVLTERGLGPGARGAAQPRPDPGRDRRPPRGPAPGAGRGGRVLRRRRGDHQRRPLRAGLARDGGHRALQRRHRRDRRRRRGRRRRPRSGTGLRGLAARVEALNGRLDIDSAPGQGTRVRAEIPSPH